MHRSFSVVTAALAALAPAVAASDASPYIIASSTTSLPGNTNQLSTLTTHAFLSAAVDVIKTCSSSAYILVSQPNLLLSDLTSHASSAPHLKSLLKSVPASNRWVADEVLASAELGMDGVVEALAIAAKEYCDAEVEGVDVTTGGLKQLADSKPKLLLLSFPALPASSASASVHAESISNHDAMLHAVMELIPAQGWTVFYASSSPESSVRGVHESVDQNYHGSELKRRGAGGNATEGGLFHRYQFFTPGIFMGYTVGLVLALVLYVGLSAIGGLTVSYGAFEKEMGPAAQKKQQQ